MSAFMCSERHISALVSFAAKSDVRYTWNGARVCVKVVPTITARTLFAENARSVNHRYPDHPPEDPHMSTYQEKGAAVGLKPIDILKLCGSYDYQACETDDYDETEAARIINAIRAEAVRHLPGYDNAKWEI